MTFMFAIDSLSWIATGRKFRLATYYDGADVRCTKGAGGGARA
jgi:hypothetical protein